MLEKSYKSKSFLCFYSQTLKLLVQLSEVTREYAVNCGKKGKKRGSRHAPALLPGPPAVRYQPRARVRLGTRSASLAREFHNNLCRIRCQYFFSYYFKGLSHQETTQDCNRRLFQTSWPPHRLHAACSQSHFGVLFINRTRSLFFITKRSIISAKSPGFIIF